jgi:hypothetical protein
VFLLRVASATIPADLSKYRNFQLGTDLLTVSAQAGEKAAAAKLVAARPTRVQDEVMARWEDAQYRVELLRAPYGTTFRLVATVKRLEAPARAALLEAKRLDEQEAPARESAQAAEKAQSEQARLEKLSLVNKPNFRP